MSKPKILRVHFEDNGQDFLYFDIEERTDTTGQIIDAQPFQRGIWTKNICTNFDELEEDGAELEFSQGVGMSIYIMKHAIEKVEDVTDIVSKERAEAEAKAQAEREKKQQEKTLKTQD